MTITEVRLKDSTASMDERGYSRYMLTYEVSTDDQNDLAQTVRQAAGIPLIGDTYQAGNDSDSNAWCRSKQVSLLQVNDSYNLWRVSCEFSDTPGQLPQSQFTHYLDIPASWSGGLVQFSRDYHQDRDGNQLKNAAGEPFIDPAITGDDSRLSIVCEKNFSWAKIGTFAAFKDAINSTPFWGFEAKRLKIQALSFTERYHSPTEQYIAARLEVLATEASTVTWDRDVLNAGYKQKVGGKLVKIKADDGLDTTRPWPLTATGLRMDTTSITAGNETYITADIYPLKEFRDLGFPTVLGAG